jgi:Phospholipase_D-nuclease N-terminal
MTTHALSSPAGDASGRPSRKSIVLGLVSFAPLVAFAGALVSFLLIFLRLKNALDEPFGAFGPEAAGLDSGFALDMAFVMVAAVASIVAFVALVVDALTNPTITPDQRVLWVVVLLFVNIVGFPVYWYIVHWRPLRDPQRGPLSAPSSSSIERSS